MTTYYVELGSKIKGIMKTTLIVDAESKKEAREKALQGASWYRTVRSVKSIAESRAEAGNHGTR